MVLSPIAYVNPTLNDGKRVARGCTHVAHIPSRPATERCPCANTVGDISPALPYMVYSLLCVVQDLYHQPYIKAKVHAT